MTKPPENREHGWRLRKTGSGHPRSKIVVTPEGRYDNAAAAGKAHGITRQAAAARARNGTDGWFYTTYYYRPAP